MITPNVLVVAVLLALAAGTAGGYKVRSWQAANGEKEVLSSELHSIHENLGILAIVNADTNDQQEELLKQQTATNKAIQGVKDAIKTKPVGGCSLTPDADSLRQQAYQATVGSLPK